MNGKKAKLLRYLSEYTPKLFRHVCDVARQQNQWDEIYYVTGTPPRFNYEGILTHRNTLNLQHREELPVKAYRFAKKLYKQDPSKFNRL